MPEKPKIFPWGFARLGRQASGGLVPLAAAILLPAAAILCALLLASHVPAATITLTDVASSNYRWLNVADQAYEAAYRSSDNYTQATAQFTYNPSASVFGGTLSATNLKPNFAYQLKLSGMAETAPAANERIGLAGRWWKETWNDAAHMWDNGVNLNDKGTGYPPTPNDVNYYAWRDIADPTSPTGLRYKFTGYLVFDYFITDDCGNVSLATQQDSSFHVLWKTTQGSYTHGASDGPLKSSTFDPNPASAAYDTDYPASTVTIYGEWERLPAGGVFLAPGDYACQMVLTEESFHGTAEYAGSWAAAMGGDISFTVVPEPGTMTVFGAALAALALARRRRCHM